MNQSKYFSEKEMACQHCGEVNWQQDFMEWLDEVREECGFPFVVTSGYRCPDHPIEAKKSSGPGSHSTGRAVDIAIAGPKAIKVIEVASRHGCKRVGVNANILIHLDDDPNRNPAIWTY